mmetsp:Transcript_26533/g.4648  ORF Transcript_26533/g.4648 Transcript_26533/m.4648 type:complete len:124 (+) Transcript_26533:3395-3766(+)
MPFDNFPRYWDSGYDRTIDVNCSWNDVKKELTINNEDHPIREVYDIEANKCVLVIIDTRKSNLPGGEKGMTVPDDPGYYTIEMSAKQKNKNNYIEQSFPEIYIPPLDVPTGYVFRPNHVEEAL